MELNADFDARAAMHSEQLKWRASPMKGVSRRMLDRIGDEVARATTIVRYDPGSHFSAHTHTGGEEYIVLDGVFQDEHGDFPVGSYVRNPPSSSHIPRSEPGTVIFVKLWQFDMDDRTHVNINMNEAKAIPAQDREGVEVLPLHKDTREDVRMENWAPGIRVTVDTEGGAEFLVLEGSFEEAGDVFEKHSWLRVPKGYDLSITAGKKGARVWVKTGHLDYVTTPEQAQ